MVSSKDSTYEQWSIFYVRDECNCSTTQGWEYHELWNLSSLSKFFKGNEQKKLWIWLAGSSMGVQIHLVPLRKTHDYPALLMDDILYLQRLDGKVSRMEHLHPSLRAKLHCRNDVNKNQEPPNQNPTRLLSYAPFNLFWHPEGGSRYTYVNIYVYITCWFDANPLWKILGQFFVQREQSFTRHHVAPNFHWNHPNIFRFPSVPEDYSWWVNGENL